MAFDPTKIIEENKKALEENKVDEDADETSTYRQNINP